MIRQRRKIFQAFAGLALLGVLSACNEVRTVDTNSTPKVEVGQLSYQNVTNQVFEARCISCHGSAGGVNLESYESVKVHLPQILVELQEGSMPPSGALPADLVALVKAWSDHGAPLTAPSN